MITGDQDGHVNVGPDNDDNENQGYDGEDIG